MGLARVLDENGNVHANCFQIGDQNDAPIVPPEHVAPPAVARSETQERREQVAKPVASVTKATPIQDAPLTTRKLIAQLKARLKKVEREIKVRKTLESERDQIRRLIAAAETERNNLRRIRDAG